MLYLLSYVKYRSHEKYTAYTHIHVKQKAIIHMLMSLQQLLPHSVFFCLQLHSQTNLQKNCLSQKRALFLSNTTQQVQKHSQNKGVSALTGNTLQDCCSHSSKHSEKVLFFHFSCTVIHDIEEHSIFNLKISP